MVTGPVESGHVSASEDPSKADTVLALVAQTGRSLSRSYSPASNTGRLIEEIADAYQTPIEYAVFPTLVLGVDSNHRTIAMHRSGQAFRFDQIAASQHEVQLARRAAVPAEQALASLRRIECTLPPLRARWRLLGYVLMAGGIAAFFRLSPISIAGALVLGALVGGVLLALQDRGLFADLMPVVLTFGSALVVAAAANWLDLDDPVRLAAVPLVVLIPGAALTAALIELSSGEMVAGTARLAYALMLLLSMAFGFAAAVDLTGMPLERLHNAPVHEVPVWAMWVGACVYALGCLLYFCTPRRLALMAVVVPLTTVVLDQLLQLVASPALAAGIAAGTALCLAWLANGGSNNGPSVIVYYLPAFWLLVPGISVFVSLTGVLTGDDALAGVSRETGLTLLSIAVGIMMAGLCAPLIRQRVPRPDDS